VPTVARLGLDAGPLDIARREDADWLRAAIWPGETVRLERLESAIRAFLAAAPRPRLEVCRAADAPARIARLAAEHPGALTLVCQTVVREYLAPDERAAYEGGLRDWLAAAPRGAALWVELESPPDRTAERPAALTAHAAAGGGQILDVQLARCGYHPTELWEDDAAVAALRRCLLPA
jgi:hypothetical protein